MTTFSDEQFKMLLSAIKSEAVPPSPTATSHKNDPAVLGPMPACQLGSNKMMKLTKFEEWLEEAENRMAYIVSNDDFSKAILLKTWGGSEITEFIKTHKITSTSYDEMIEGIKKELTKLVNRTMALHELYTTKQGSMKWMDYIHELEKKVKILNFEKQPYTNNDAVKDAAIFGMTDQRLREKALAEDPDLETLTRWGHAREAGKSDAHTLKDVTGGSVKRIGWNSEDSSYMDEEEIDNLIDSLKVMKLKKAGKYSSKYKREEGGSVCQRCLTNHEKGRCPAKGKECFSCGGKNHLSYAFKSKSAKRVASDDCEKKGYCDTRTTDSSEPKDTQNNRKIAV